ncbi:MAG: 50S ribosomal protein L4 [Thermoleophilia bacterium]
MTPVPVLDTAGLAAGTAPLAEVVAQTPIKQHLIHETVIAELAGRRAGTHSTLTRGKVRGGGAKPWRQKGTGRARQGSTRAPHWSGGGIVFGPTPRSYGGKVNRKVRQQAFRAALRAQAERGSLAVMDATGWDTPSTKAAAEYLRQAPDGLQVRPLLVIVQDLDGVEARAFRNIEGVYVLAGSELETVDVVAARAILVERAVWEGLTGGPIEVEAVSPAPKAKPKPRKKKPAAPANVVAPAEEPKPKRSRSKKAAAEDEAPADEAVAEETEAEEAVAEATEPEAEAAETPEAEETETAEEPDAGEAEEADDAPEATADAEAEAEADDETEEKGA